MTVDLGTGRLPWSFEFDTLKVPVTFVLHGGTLDDAVIGATVAISGQG